MVNIINRQKFYSHAFGRTWRTTFFIKIIKFSSFFSSLMKFNSLEINLDSREI